MKENKMNLTKIKEQNCPECACAHIVTETKKDRHCSRKWNEYRTFACGMTLHYSPNFKRVVKEGECKKSVKYLEEEQQRVEAKKKIEKYISKLDVPEEFKNRIVDSIRFVT